MPTETFLKLAEEKRNAFIEVALKEFADHNYDTASINRIIKELNIARGSVYQYFTDKLDLWLYLKAYSEQQKLKHIQSLDRNKYPDFWTYYEDLFIKGITFDIEQPLCSRFLYRIGYKETSKEVAEYINNWQVKAREIFTVWVENEKINGSINKNVKTETAVQFILSVSSSIGGLVQNKFSSMIENNLKKEKPLFTESIDEYKATVKEFIHLLKKALL
ncbi:TetR/AcrR family transcriptional regulator [Cyclobacteriaceae bacterium YHN15]|nr:TetR/AcrR family transcriptional regulator [Cyclobacteriaceae bacterium YHN15]